MTALRRLIYFFRRPLASLEFLSARRKFLDRMRSTERYARERPEFRLYPQLDDRTRQTEYDRHYVLHPAWAARVLKESGTAEHVDIGSTLHFAPMISAWLECTFYDFRPARMEGLGLASGAADLTRLSFSAGSIASLSCMHVLEHIGLGRYGDPIDPVGDLKAASELVRVLAPNGQLLVVVPVGVPAIEFNAHRIYSYEQVLELFKGLELAEFALIPDSAQDGDLLRHADPAMVRTQTYACGCFRFKKPQGANAP